MIMNDYNDTEHFANFLRGLQWRTQEIFSRRGGGGLTLHACHDGCCARPEKKVAKRWRGRGRELCHIFSRTRPKVVAERGWGGGGGCDNFFSPSCNSFRSTFQTRSRCIHRTSSTSLTSKQQRKEKGGGVTKTKQTLFRIGRVGVEHP